MPELLLKTTHSESFDKDGLHALVKDVLHQAAALGATGAEVGVSVASGFNVMVRLGEVDTVEYNRDKGVGLTVFFDHRKGSASSSDTSPAAIKAAVEKACHIARFTAEDPCAGLADKELMATQTPDLDLYHPWAITTEEAIQLAKDCEATAMARDKRLNNSDGANVSTFQGYRVYGNSHGFIGGYAGSRHSISCSLIASQEGQMQRDYSYSVARDPEDLLSINDIAKEAAERTLRRLAGHRLKTCRVPVLFEASIAGGLVSSFLTAIRGSQLYRKSTFLLDKLHESVFAKGVHIYEDPYVLKGLGSAPFDDEGVRPQKRDLVRDGILEGYLLSSYSARKLGLQTTGNAGSSHNIYITQGNDDLPALLKKMDKGLLVTELMGQGVNIVNGDYSRGASGFWVEHGEIQYPVEEITIAGNLRDMFLTMVGVGTDVDRRSHIQSGSILLEQMTVAGH